jgi:hypothetical protein
VNRATSSSVARNATAVTGPTPGVVASPRTTASAARRRAIPASAIAMAAFSGVSNSTTGAIARCTAGGTSTCASRRANAAALPLGTRIPSRRNRARITLR